MNEERLRVRSGDFESPSIAEILHVRNALSVFVELVQGRQLKVDVIHPEIKRRNYDTMVENRKNTEKKTIYSFTVPRARE